MSMDEFDNILLYDKKVEPSPTFTRNVMAQVESEISAHRPLSFPWIPFSVCMLVVGLLSFWLFPADSFVAGTKTAIETFGIWIASPEDHESLRVIQYLFFSLSGTLVLIWLSFRLTDDSY